MRVGFVYEVTPGDWTDGFVRNLTAGLRVLSYVDVVPVDLTGINIKSQAVIAAQSYKDRVDCWLLMQHHEWAAEVLLNTGKPVYAFMHGESFSQSIHAPDKNIEAADALLPSFAGLFTSTQFYRDVVQAAVPDTPVYAVGFPVDLVAYHTDAESHALHRRSIDVIVPGRLHWDKQPLLIADALEGYDGSVVFCTGRKDLGRNGQKIARYLESRGFSVEIGCTGADYHGLLLDSRVVLTGSRTDTLNMCMVEGILCRCLPVAPNLGPFPSYIPEENLYEPFSLREIRMCIEAARPAYNSALDFLSRCVVGRKIGAVL